jgi:hypothetical protein
LGRKIVYIGKMKPLFLLLLLAGILTGQVSIAQTPTSYKLPDIYRFDYAVEQVLTSKGHAADTSVMHFYYTKSGDYAAARISGKAGRKGNLLMILTREGMSVIFDEHNKSITLINVRKLASDLSGLTKWIRMDSLMAHLHQKGDEKGFQSVKTGQTKPIGGYTAEEYKLTGKKDHRGSVWFTRVDFNTMGDYMLGAVGAGWLKMIGYQKAGDPLFQALTQSKTLITAINLTDSTGEREMNMHTLSIDPLTTTISTSGYTLNDYSNMTLSEIFQAEMKKRN